MVCSNPTKKMELDLQFAEPDLRWKERVAAAERLHIEALT